MCVLTSAAKTYFPRLSVANESAVLAVLFCTETPPMPAEPPATTSYPLSREALEKWHYWHAEVQSAPEEELS